MSLQQSLGIGAGAALIAFIVFAVRQGPKMRPDDREDRGPWVETGDNSSGGHDASAN
jgi:hypothetical protein